MEREITAERIDLVGELLRCQVAWFVSMLRRHICSLTIGWHNTDVVPNSKILQLMSR